ncbi:MAG: coproporphyrinogen III oxidase [Acetobacter sp.]|nr:coproporphyrinogen III oxidase [Acetobacter sp.]
MPSDFATQEEPLALYIHWPFCLSRCPYCDFNTYVRKAIPQKRFRDLLCSELAYEANRLGRRRLASIFFGGGTPSLMFPETVSQIITEATTYFDPVSNLEITLEANPTSVEVEKLTHFRQAGVNRISLGVQAFDEQALQFLGRQHSVAQAYTAIEAAKALFPRVSFDLIYARPEQTFESWQRELRSALNLMTEHIALYQLTIEQGTRFDSLYQAGRLTLPHEEEAAALYTITNDIVSSYGLRAYEVSNYARLGCESRHNLVYWRYGDYLGIGPGAHSRFALQKGLYAVQRQRVPELWADFVEQRGTGQSIQENLEPRARAREMLLMGLRVEEGINLHRFAQRTGMTLEQSVDHDILNKALEENYLVQTETILRTTQEGRLRLEALLSALVL